MVRRPEFARDLLKYELLSHLKDGLLPLSVEGNKFMDTSLNNMKDMSEELRELLDGILKWTPSPHRQEEILEKLRQFQDKGIVKMFEEQGTSLEKGLCTVPVGVEVDLERVLPVLKTIFSLVKELKQRLHNGHSIEELRSMKERLQKELCEAIEGINDVIEKVEETELDCTVNELLNWMMGGSNDDY